MQYILSILLLAGVAADVRAVTIHWLPVGNPGNAPDFTHYGAVAYNYNIAEYDVTNNQYVEFLNAKDPTGADPLGLWPGTAPHYSMYGGITFNSAGANGNKYSVIAGDGNYPVNGVSPLQAIRFANWMDNGQGNGDTESGAYTLLGGTPVPSNFNNLSRNAGATIFLPSEDEWYKVAYYNPTTHAYFQYATSSNTLPNLAGPTPVPNSVNLSGALTNVGAYTGTTSPYGAYDMNGDVFQWSFRTTVGDKGPVTRGGAFDIDARYLLSSNYVGGDTENDVGDIAWGFRLAAAAGVPEPSSLALATVGFIGLATWRWRRRKH